MTRSGETPPLGHRCDYVADPLQTSVLVLCSDGERLPHVIAWGSEPWRTVGSLECLGICVDSALGGSGWGLLRDSALIDDLTAGRQSVAWSAVD